MKLDTGSSKEKKLFPKSIFYNFRRHLPSGNLYRGLRLKNSKGHLTFSSLNFRDFWKLTWGSNERQNLYSSNRYFFYFSINAKSFFFNKAYVREGKCMF